MFRRTFPDVNYVQKLPARVLLVLRARWRSSSPRATSPQFQKSGSTIDHVHTRFADLGEDLDRSFEGLPGLWLAAGP